MYSKKPLLHQSKYLKLIWAFYLYRNCKAPPLATQFLSYLFFSSVQLPAVIDRRVAATTFKNQRAGLLKLIHRCLPSLAHSLYAQFLIPRDAHERAINKSIGVGEKGVALLDCIEARIEVVPSDFTKIVRVLESEPELQAIASQLVQSYCEYLNQWQTL